MNMNPYCVVSLQLKIHCNLDIDSNFKPLQENDYFITLFIFLNNQINILNIVFLKHWFEFTLLFNPCL